MAIDSQLLKGVLEGCVLAIIVRGETYGYEILSELARTGLAGIGEGTLYPVLTRMDKQGYVTCRKAKSPLGPIRKYYTITPRGCEKLQSFQGDFQTMVTSVEQILEQEKEG